MAARPRWSAAAIGAVVMTLVLTGACDSGASRDCQAAGSANVCLARGTPSRLTATGLDPESPVVVSLDGASPPVPPTRPMVAGADGRYPPPGATSGVAIPTGSGPQKVTVTVTPRGGAPITVTFQR